MLGSDTASHARLVRMETSCAFAPHGRITARKRTLRRVRVISFIVLFDVIPLASSLSLRAYKCVRSLAIYVAKVRLIFQNNAVFFDFFTPDSAILRPWEAIIVRVSICYFMRGIYPQIPPA